MSKVKENSCLILSDCLFNHLDFKVLTEENVWHLDDPSSFDSLAVSCRTRNLQVRGLRAARTRLNVSIFGRLQYDNLLEFVLLFYLDLY